MVDLSIVMLVYQRVTGNSDQFLVSHPKVGQKTAILEPPHRGAGFNPYRLSSFQQEACGTLGLKHQHPGASNRQNSTPKLWCLS
jgi:hypothetical protein